MSRLRGLVWMGLLAALLLGAPAAHGEDINALGTHKVFLPLQLREEAASPEQRVIELTNAQRAAAGCPPLAISPALMQAAAAHSQDMAARNYFSHIGPDNSTPSTRAVQSGFTPYTIIAENIAAGYATADAVVAGWMASPEHRGNILNCSLREIGVGYAHSESATFRDYWTQSFGTRP